MRILFPLAAALATAGCLYPHPPPAPAPTELAYAPGCGDAAFPAYGSAATLDRFAGRYRLGTTVIAVRNDGGRLLLDRPGFPARQLGPGDLAAGRFVDGCGLRYDFAGDSLTITLADGSATRWTRVGG
jgi:hypothetical protein